MFFAPSAMHHSDTCVVWDGGVQCGKPTGSTEPGVDADLCPEHRAQMEAQRQEWSAQ